MHAKLNSVLQLWMEHFDSRTIVSKIIFYLSCVNQYWCIIVFIYTKIFNFKYTDLLFSFFVYHIHAKKRSLRVTTKKINKLCFPKSNGTFLFQNHSQKHIFFFYPLFTNADVYLYLNIQIYIILYLYSYILLSCLSKKAQKGFLIFITF